MRPQRTRAPTLLCGEWGHPWGASDNQTLERIATRMIVSMGILSDLRADYAVNRRPLDRITVTAFRINQASQRGRLTKIKRVAAKAIDVLWMQGVVGADMPGQVQCGPGLRLPHGGRGVALDPRAVIGSNVAIFPNAGIGRGGRERLSAVIEDDVTIYRGALVAGPITVGRGSTVAANSVALQDVAAGTTVIGVPATVPTK